MLNIFILVLAVVTLALMTSNPRASVQQQPSAWQKASSDRQNTAIQNSAIQKPAATSKPDL